MNNRTPNFVEDNEYGKIGERLLYNILRSSPKTIEVIDISSQRGTRKDDIDILQRVNDRTYKYEVKTDTYGVKTRNISYELTSHDFAGCLARSNSDYIFYVFINGVDKNVSEAYLIKLERLRRWIGLNCRMINKSDMVGRLVYSTTADVDGRPMNCLQLLINIDTLVKDNVAKKIDINGY